MNRKESSLIPTLRSDNLAKYISLDIWKWRPYNVRSLVLTPFRPKGIEMA